MYVCVCVSYVCICMYVCIMYVCMYVCMYVRLCLLSEGFGGLRTYSEYARYESEYMYVCMYVHTFIHTCISLAQI